MQLQRAGGSLGLLAGDLDWLRAHQCTLHAATLSVAAAESHLEAVRVVGDKLAHRSLDRRVIHRVWPAEVPAALRALFAVPPGTAMRCYACAALRARSPVWARSSTDAQTMHTLETALGGLAGCSAPRAADEAAALESDARDRKQLHRMAKRTVRHNATRSAQ